MKAAMKLCSANDMVDGQCKTFDVQDGAFTREIFTVCQHGKYYAYYNSCPHTGAPLDWMPDQFLSLDKTHIQCSTHQALFRIEDGYCVSGPCAGQSLHKVAVRVDQGFVIAEIGGNGGSTADS